MGRISLEDNSNGLFWAPSARTLPTKDLPNGHHSTEQAQAAEVQVGCSWCSTVVPVAAYRLAAVRED